MVACGVVRLFIDRSLNPPCSRLPSSVLELSFAGKVPDPNATGYLISEQARKHTAWVVKVRGSIAAACLREVAQAS